MSLKRSKYAYGFTTMFAVYGKMVNKKEEYQVALLIPPWKGITIYRGKKKPIIRNLIFITILWFPFVALVYAGAFIVSLLYLLFFEFHHIGLVTDKQFTDGITKISGWVSGVLMLIGIASLILYLTSHLKIV